MTSLQEQYIQAMKQSQEAVLSAVDSWAKTVQQSFGQAPTAAVGSVDPYQIIDEVFTFAEKLLETQRQFAKSLVAASTPATEGAQGGQPSE
jgi:acetyl-CoA carboxylase carboxyltransferase component